MSRIGKKEIKIPEKTTASLEGHTLTVVGPLGSLSREFPEEVTIKITPENITTSIVDTGEGTAVWGTASSHIFNMVEGVNKVYEKKLLIEGIGYKVEVRGDKIVMGLGFSHPVTVEIPKNIKVSVDKNIITISGIDKEKVGEFTAGIRDQKKPEPYKGKGIMYVGEVVRRKQGKKAV